MKSNLPLATASAVFAVALAVIPAQPAAAGPVVTGKAKAVQAIKGVEGVCTLDTVNFDICVFELDKLKAALGF